MDSEPELFRKVSVIPYDPDPLREIIRGLITLVAALCFLTVVGFYLVQAPASSDTGWTHTKEAMQSVLPADTSLLGTSLGFYFGSQKR